MTDRSAEKAEEQLRLANALMREGRPAEAAACYGHAIALAPDRADARYNLGVALRDLGRWAEAERQFRDALVLNPDHAEAHNNLGLTLQNQGRLDEAAACYRRAIALRPGHAKAHYNLALALQHQGRLDDAASSYRRALELKPDYARAHYNLALQGALGDGSPEAEVAFARLCAELQRLADYEPADRALLLFAAGKALEQRGEFDLAFAHLEAANAIVRAGLAFDIGTAERRMASIVAAFDKPLFGRLADAGLKTERPIFLVGMARSGTTLVEQIVSAHPKVLGAGEIPNFAVVAASLRATRGAAGAAWTATLTAADCLEHGRIYLDSLPAAAGRTRVTDKSLLNVEHLGLIHLCLPQARIIHCRRDPRDVCFSCFAERFGDGQDYAYNLAELGRYWRAYDGLMAHWRSVLPPGRLFEVDYEAVVGDLETWARRLIAHCGLEWDSACLRFHQSGREVRTASFAQVRRPIYGGSVGRWRPFARHLRPLLAALGPPWETGSA